MNRISRVLATALIAMATTLPAFAQTPTWTLKRRDAATSLRTKGEVRELSTSLGDIPSQRTCHTMMHDSLLRARYPQLGSLAEFETALSTAMAQRRASGLMSATTLRIPVIVHIVHSGEARGQGANISEAQVASQIEVLNEDYRMKAGTPGHNSNPKGADAGIEFVRALFDPNGTPLAEHGIDRVNGGRANWTYDAIEGTLKPQTQWDPEAYLNIWVVNFDPKVGLLGYAQFPNLSGLDGMQPNQGSASTDGVVINYRAFGRGGSAAKPYDAGRTATHEIGHWLGLRHIWGDGDCTVDDFCDDTPEAGTANYVCDDALNSCAAPDRDMVENYMDYTNDACMNIFTACQRDRMRTVLERSPRRKNLVKSDAGTETLRPIASFAADRQSGCEGVTITFNDRSANAPTSWLWAFYVDGEFAASFTDQNPSLTFPGASLWDVLLIVSNANGSDTLFVPNFLAIISDDDMTLPFDVDFEAGAVLPNWTMFNPDDDRGWILSDAASGYGVGAVSAAFDNYTTETDPSGTIDAMISAPLDLAADRFATISFDMAYAQYEDAKEQLNDTLALFFSTDCGENWVPFWWKGGSDLATAGPTEEAFDPTDDQWRSESVSLGFLNGRTVHLAIANISNWGNWLYIDNVRIAVESPQDAPVADFYAGSTAVCEGGVVAFTDASDGAPREWNWSFPGGTPATSQQQHPRVLYAQPGSYAVTLEVTGPNGTDTYTEQDVITVAERPDVFASATKTTINAGETVRLSASGAVVYYWSNGRDNETVMASTIDVAPVTTTTYHVFGFADDDCPGEASVTITVADGPTSVELPVLATTTMTISPNPASTEIALDLELAAHDALSISLIDMAGRVVMSFEADADAGRFMRRIDVSELPAGVYAVRVAGARSTSMQRFVKR